MANTASTTQIRTIEGKTHPVTKKRVPFLQFNPLWGMSQQDTTVQQSAWIRIGAGVILNLKLSVTALSGTLDVAIETMHNPSDNSENPRALSADFQQVPAGGESYLTAPCDEYIRITATPGAGGGQTATWTISGSGYFGMI
jgi:hypothetical protein